MWFCGRLKKEALVSSQRTREMEAQVEALKEKLASTEKQLTAEKAYAASSTSSTRHSCFIPIFFFVGDIFVFVFVNRAHEVTRAAYLQSPSSRSGDKRNSIPSVSVSCLL